MEDDEQTILLKEFARQQNRLLMNSNKTLDAYKLLIDPNKLDKIKASFDFIDPYCQAVLIQSVINLDSRQFSSIEQKYREIIAKGLQSPDEWVKRTAHRFSEFPKIITDEDIDSALDISALESIKAQRTTSGTFINYIEERLDPTIKPPSQEIQQPVLPLKKSVQPIPQKKPEIEILTKSFEHNPAFNLAQHKKKKGKEMHDINELVKAGKEKKTYS